MTRRVGSKPVPLSLLALLVLVVVVCFDFVFVLSVAQRASLGFEICTIVIVGSTYSPLSNWIIALYILVKI
jgi:hypothetical protein